MANNLMLNDSTRKRYKVDSEEVVKLELEHQEQSRQLRNDILSECDRDWISDAGDDDNAPPEIDPQELEVRLEVESEVDRYKRYALRRDYAIMWVWHQLRQNYDYLSYGELKLIGEELGFKPGWCWYRWQEQQEHQQQDLVQGTTGYDDTDNELWR